LLACTTVVPSSAQVMVDPNLPSYERVEGVSGNLNAVGSDTLNNLMTLWAESFRAIYKYRYFKRDFIAIPSGAQP
jgi:phosphate transport system substrate-binding protein